MHLQHLTRRYVEQSIEIPVILLKPITVGYSVSDSSYLLFATPENLFGGAGILSFHYLLAAGVLCTLRIWDYLNNYRVISPRSRTRPAIADWPQMNRD